MAFTVTIDKMGISGCGAYDTPSQEVSKKEFATVEEARKEVRRLLQKEGYKKHGYNVFNPTLGTEVSTNF